MQIPSDFQSHEGNDFHGVGWYRTSVTGLQVPAGSRLLLHFQAAATEAEVWWNGQRLGLHLDPFMDDLDLLAVGNPKTGQLELRIPVRGAAPERMSHLTVRHRLRGAKTWTSPRLSLAATARPARSRMAGAVLLAEVPVAHPKLWSPASPALYEVEVALTGPPPFAGHGRCPHARRVSRHRSRGRGVAPQRSAAERARRAELGLLPARLSPLPDEATMRRDLEFARSYGFNLMKFCLRVSAAFSVR